MRSNQVSDAMRQCTRLTTTSSCNHQQRSLMMVDSLALSIIKASKKTQVLNLKIGESFTFNLWLR